MKVSGRKKQVPGC